MIALGGTLLLIWRFSLSKLHKVFELKRSTGALDREYVMKFAANQAKKYKSKRQNRTMIPHGVIRTSDARLRMIVKDKTCQDNLRE